MGHKGTQRLCHALRVQEPWALALTLTPRPSVQERRASSLLVGGGGDKVAALVVTSVMVLPQACVWAGGSIFSPTCSLGSEQVPP